jgi:peroxin-2
VNQLDSQMIDGELEDTLLEPMLSSLDGVVEDAWKERIALALKLTLLFCSLRASLPAAGRSSYGARLENLKWVHAATGNSKLTYIPHHVSFLSFSRIPSLKLADTWHTNVWIDISNKQVLLYTLLSILPSYFHAKARDGMLSLGWADEPSSGHWRTSLSERHRRRTCWEMAERVDLLLRFAQVVNLLMFLHHGGARTLVERALRIRLVPASRELQRAVPFEFLSRQIVWQALTVCLPLSLARPPSLLA